MRLRARVTVAKEGGDPDTNEDYCAWRAARRSWAVSDGASESFASKRWARILALSFVASSYVDEQWIADATYRYAQAFEKSSMPWNKAAAFKRGSFATLLGAVWLPEWHSIDIYGFGDSIAILLDGNRPLECFPYTSVEQFNERPLLVSTRMDLNGALLARSEREFRRVFQIGRLSQPILLLVTDALGKWVLTDLEARCGELLRAMDSTAFVQLVMRERHEKRMRVDDTTMLVLG